MTSSCRTNSIRCRRTCTTFNFGSSVACGPIGACVLVGCGRECSSRTCYAGTVGGTSAIGFYLLTCHTSCPVCAIIGVGRSRIFPQPTTTTYTVRGTCAVGRDVLAAGAIGPWLTSVLIPQTGKASAIACCACVIEYSCLVRAWGTVLSAYHAFVGILAGGANRVLVAVVFALGGGCGTSFRRRVCDHSIRRENNIN